MDPSLRTHPPRARRAAWQLTAVMLVLLAAPLGAQVFDTEITPDEPFEDWFGSGVALSGNTLAVGAPGDNDSGGDSGSVHVYVHDGSSWGLQAELIASDAFSNGQFGYAVSMDGEALLVGAWGTSDGSWVVPGFHRGAAYVFRREGTLWTEEARLQPAVVAEHDFFGRAVGIDGDVVVVGAPYADPMGSRSGRAWIFRKVGDTWVEEASLVPADGADQHRFGESVSVSGSTVVVGAPRADGAVLGAGAAYVYVHDGSTWNLEAKISAASGAIRDRFGSAISLDGDTLAVGVTRHDASGTPNAGAIAVYTRNAGRWSQQAWLTAGTPHPMANLGTALALQGDVIVASAPEDDDAGPKTGAAYLFRRADGVWSQQAKLLSPVAEDGEAIGAAVALDGDRAVIGTVWRTYLPVFGRGAVDLWTGVEP